MKLNPSMAADFPGGLLRDRLCRPTEATNRFDEKSIRQWTLKGNAEDPNSRTSLKCFRCPTKQRR